MSIFFAILIGFGASVLAGMFGIGGGSITTPALRLLLGVSPAIALGTTLPLALPTSITGAATFNRQGLVDKTTAAYAGLSGMAGAVAGSLLTAVIDLHYLMLLTGIVVIYVSVTCFNRGIRERSPSSRENTETEKAAIGGVFTETGTARYRLTASFIGITGGFFSGLLGIGGGVVFVPAFLFLLKMPIKKAMGSSHAVMALVIIPGVVVHAFLGHISWMLLLWLLIGVVPGAWLGARFSIKSSERMLYLLFGILLAAVGVIFIVNEIKCIVG